MRSVLFDDEGIRQDRAGWLNRAVLVCRVIVIMRPNEIIPDIDLPLEYRVFRFMQDAQRALMQDPEPLFLITEDTDDLSKETFAFSENILSRYQINLR